MLGRGCRQEILKSEDLPGRVRYDLSEGEGVF